MESQLEFRFTFAYTVLTDILTCLSVLQQAGGTNLDEKKGPFENTLLDVPEATPVPYPVYQVSHRTFSIYRYLSNNSTKNYS